MKSRPSYTSFTLAFYKARQPVSTEVVPTEAVKTERAQRVKIENFRNGITGQFSSAQKPSDFKTLQRQFAAVIDRVSTFAEVNANQVTPALSTASVAKMKENLNIFKGRVTNTDADFFDQHRTLIYDHGKDILHAIDERLHMDTLSLQSRMNVLQAMAPGLPTCSGGVMTSLQGALQTLQLGESGLKGMAYQTKVKMVEALILDYVRANHTYSPGNEVHYVNEYFNKLAEPFGLLPRKDLFVGMAKLESDEKHHIERCKKTIYARLTPEALAMAMADDYLGKVKNAVVEAPGVRDLTGPVDGDQLTELNEICKTAQLVTLDKEFGKVPMDKLVHSIEDRDDMEYPYQLATNPIAIAQHFLQDLKGQELVDYEKTINLSDEDSPHGTLKMLGTLLWMDKEGVCEEAKLADILAVSPKEMHRTLTEKEGMSRADSYAILGALVQQVNQITTQDRIASVPAAWVGELVEVYHQDGKLDSGPATWRGNPSGTLAERLEYNRQAIMAWGGNPTGILANGTTVIDRRWSNALAMLAAKQGHAAPLDAMCRNMVHRDQMDEDGRSFASHAAENGHLDVLQVLKNRGANLNLPDKAGDTPLIWATGMGHVDTVKFLCKSNVDVNIRNRVGETPVMRAAWDGLAEVIEVLLDAGGHAEAGTPDGFSALAMAAHLGHGDVVDALIAHGADVNGQDNEGNSVVARAIYSGHTDILNKLIAKDASIDATDRFGGSPLMYAVSISNGDAVKILVGAKAKLDVADIDGMTALMYAVEKQNLPAVEALIAAGADLNIKNKGNQNAATIANNLGHMDILNKLLGK